MRKLALLVAALLVLGATATAVEGQDTVRVKIEAGPFEQSALKSEIGVRYDFGDVFTTTVTEKKFDQLQRRGVDVEEVPRVQILHHADWHDGGPPGSGGDSGITVSWVNPTDSETVSGVVNIKINATDSDGSIDKVEWKVDSDSSFRSASDSDGDGIWEDQWNTTKYSDGDHDLTANATDNDGNSEQSTITVTVDNEDSTSRSATPSDQTPYGIEQVYNDTSISSTSGGSGIDVVVLDTGVDTDHVDLVNRIEQCVDFTGGGPFQTKIEEGKCEDKNGHGTHVSGTALADAGSDNKGIYGVAPSSDLYAYKVLDDSGSGYADDIAKAIDYAANNGGDVASMSFGASSQSDLIAAEIKEHQDDMVFVAAAGNDGPDLDTMGYPGANNNTIGVAAVDSSYTVPDFSSRGVNDTQLRENRDRYVEIAAAGVNVESTWNDGTYNSISGTSMATPHISGYASKAWASGNADLNGDGTTTTYEVREYIQDNADVDITDGKHARQGYDPASGLGLPTVN